MNTRFHMRAFFIGTGGLSTFPWLLKYVRTELVSRLLINANVTCFDVCSDVRELMVLDSTVDHPLSVVHRFQLNGTKFVRQYFGAFITFSTMVCSDK